MAIIILLLLYTIFIASVVAGRQFATHEILSKHSSHILEKWSKTFLILNLIVILIILFQLVVIWYYFAAIILSHALISLFLVYYVLIVPFNGKNGAMKYYMVVIFNAVMIAVLHYASTMLEYLEYFVIIYTLFVSVYNIIEMRYLKIKEFHPHL